jgi:hypothetical protein
MRREATVAAAASLLLTALDVGNAVDGAIADVVILAAVWVGPRLAVALFR